jgi:hypothetical protein
MAKSILFLTSASLSTNPRLLKNTKLAFDAGFNVDIICFKYPGWSEETDKDWLTKNPWARVYEIKTSSRPNFLWWIGSLIESTCKVIYPFLKDSVLITAYGSSKRSFLLRRKIQVNTTKKVYQLIIAHNLAALYPAYSLSRKKNIPFIFDVEDYHPGEYIANDARNEKLRREWLLKNLLPSAQIITVASPLIGDRIKELIGISLNNNIVVINNCFPKDEFEFTEIFSYGYPYSLQDKQKSEIIRNVSPELCSQHAKLSDPKTSDPVNFVWFSQNIGANRGLEVILPALSKVEDKIHLHLIGHLYNEFNLLWIQPHQKFITVYPPIPQKDLNRFICNFDIGLALELPTSDENRSICLTNKLWAYLQAGLFIIATDTPAQVEFMKKFDQHGLIINSNNSTIIPAKHLQISKALEFIIENIHVIREKKSRRFDHAKEFSWDTEKEKLGILFQ